MAGEIHGIIDREQAYQTWKPYGERAYADYDHQLYPERLTPVEAAHVYSGISDEDRQSFEEAWSSSEYEAHMGYLDLGYDRAEQSEMEPSAKIVDWLVMQQLAQEKLAEQLRSEWEHSSRPFMKLLGKGALILAKDGVLTGEQVEKVHDWLTDEYGQPRVQYTPTTKLAEARRLKKIDAVMPRPGFAAATSMWEGVIMNSVDIGCELMMGSNRVHEHVHTAFSGMEFYDITRVDGLRAPIPTVVGVFAYEPSVDMGEVDDYSDTFNGELNEGVTDYLSHLLIDFVPELGEYDKDGDQYSEWVEKVNELRVTDPAIFRKIIDTTLTETSTSRPTAKRDALAELHEYADQRIGGQNSLTNYMVGEAGTLQQVKHG